MKIGIVCYPTLGGSGIMATELGHELALKDYEVHFITYETPFRLNVNERNIFFHQVEINRYDLFRYPDYALPLAVTIADVVRHHKLDIIHVHYAIPHATSAYLARQIVGDTHPAIITTLHGTDITLVGRDPSYFDIVKFSMEQSDAVTAVSESLKQDTLRYFHLSKPIEVIHNFFIPKPAGLDCGCLREELVATDEKLIIHASNYRRVKRPLDVVRVFAKINEKIPSRLLLLGTGDGLDQVRELVNELNLEKKVDFLGVNRDIDCYVACSDLFLLPSEQESFGLAALEAMAYGVPVIATEAGGLPELIENGVSGFLSPIGDVDQMADNAIKLLTNPELFAKVKKAARERAKTKFSLNEVLPKYEALYQRMVRQVHQNV